MSNNKAGQPKRTAPPVTLRNADASLQQRTDSTLSMQRVNEIQEHLLFGVNSKPCIETQKALHAVTSQDTYQGTRATLIQLAGFINAASGETYVSSKHLAKLIGVSRDTTDAQLERLLDSGIVAIVGKHKRSYIRTITLPCDHLAIEPVAKSAAGESSAGSSAGSYVASSVESSAASSAGSYAGTRADTYLHYQNKNRTELEQQQSEPADAGYSQAEKDAFMAELNNGLPKPKHLKCNTRVNVALDTFSDNAMPLGQVIHQIVQDSHKWAGGGGTLAALERKAYESAATYHQRKPKAALTKCTELPANVECDTKMHTIIGDQRVTKCPQREQTN